VIVAPRDALDIIHLDMDCFFAAVEAQFDPTLVGRPVIVGGLGPRGVVASASYEARVFGVRAAMPTAEARRRCPHGVFLAGRHSAYAERSADLLAVLLETTPLVEPIALDEAFLDVSGGHRLLGTSREIAERLKRSVEERLGLRCSVGVGRSKLVAKLASRRAKPHVGADGVAPGLGICVVELDEEADFLTSHGVADLPGAGPKTTESLRRHGIATVADLEIFGREALVRLLGRAQGNALFDLATGLDERTVEPNRAAKSVGSEETFDSDVTDREALESKLRELAVNVGSRVRASATAARTVSIKVRFADFTSTSRSKTLTTATSTNAVIAAVGIGLFSEVDITPGVRLIGLSLSNLGVADDAPPIQQDLFAEPGETDEANGGHHEGADRAADEIRRRFGTDAIRSLAAASRPAPRNGPTNRPVAVPREI
jgi:DNA polymerase-4